MASLLESYKNRLAISESVHQKSHNGAKMSSAKKLMIASVLNNTSKFMNEAFDSSAAMQRSALGDYKKFCLNVATVALPNLILPDLMMTQPMTSISGYITYLEYTAGTNKGGVEQGDFINGVYRLGNMTEARTRYTADRVVEELNTVKTTEVVDGEEVETDTGAIIFAWAPVVKGSVKCLVNNEWVEVTGVEDPITKKVTYTAPEGATKVAYMYDNVVIPQDGITNGGLMPGAGSSIPTLTAHMEAIDLHASARRIAVYYSQIAAFQAKTDYGYDLAEQLSAQAQGELAYEIDTEGVMMLYKGAEMDKDLVFPAYDKSIKDLGTGSFISRSQYYEMFTEIIARAKRVMYKRTQKFAPNYMVIGANVLTIMPYVKGWTAAPASTVNGPFFAGTVDGMKVYCTPAMKDNDFFFGVNGSDLQTSAAVYAPYMAIVPTQLLGFADGAMTQGFSTMYDMKLLSTYKRDTDGKVIDAPKGTGDYSYLLVAGHLDTDGTIDTDSLFDTGNMEFKKATV